MLSPESKKKLQQPGLRFQGLRNLRMGSKIALGVLFLMALVAIFAPLIAPFAPSAASLVPPDMVVMKEVEIAGVGKTMIPDNSVPPNNMFWFGTDDGGATSSAARSSAPASR